MVSRVPNFNYFNLALRPAGFELRVILRQGTEQPPNDLVHYKGVHHVYVFLYSTPEPQRSVLLQGQPLSSCKTVCTDNCTEWLETTLNVTRLKVRHIHCMCYYYPRLPIANFTPAVTWVTGHFETSALNDTKWPWKVTLNTTRSKVPIFVLLVSPSPRFQYISLYDQPWK